MQNNIQKNISFKEIKVTEWSPNVFVYFIQFQFGVINDTNIQLDIMILIFFSFPN